MMWGWIVGVRFPKLQADPHYALLKKHMDAHFKSLFAFEGLIECGWDLGIQASISITSIDPNICSPLCLHHIVFFLCEFVPPGRLTLVVASHSRPTRRFLSVAKIKSSPLTLVASLCQFKINLTLLITDPFIPFHVALSSILFIRRRTSVLEGRLNVLTANCFCVLVCAVLCFFFLQLVVQTWACTLNFLERYSQPWSVPRGLHSKAELCGRVWEEKCNDLHLNGSTLANTMGLSFTGLGPPLYSKGPAGIER